MYCFICLQGSKYPHFLPFSVFLPQTRWCCGDIISVFYTKGTLIGNRNIIYILHIINTESFWTKIYIDFVFSNLSIFRKYNTICRVFINTFAKQSSGTTYDLGKVLKKTEQKSCTTLEALTKLISVFLTNGESVSWTPTQPIILIHPSITPCDVTWVHVRKKLVVEMAVCSWTLTQPIILIYPSITPCDVTWVHVRKRLVVEMETAFTDTRTELQPVYQSV